jgi:D-proline reductase (dithiol) PrdB
MEANNKERESLEAFKNSFTSTGSRSDLNFKFLKNLSTEEAGIFLQDLLRKFGDSINDGDFTRLMEHVYLGQVKAYDRKGKWEYDQGPFTPLQKPLSESRLALITSSGHFVEGMDPEPFGVKGMTQAEAVQRIDDFLKAEPELSIVPVDTPLEKLRVRHGGYDIAGAQADPDVAFPIRKLKELENSGAFGKLNDEAYSFVGAASQTRILNHVGPQWVDRLKGQGVDVAMMVPL